MRTHRLIVASLCGLALATSGCATRTTALPLGASVSLAMAQQIRDPGAGLKPAPVDGMDGQAAKSVYDAYQKTYRAPQPQPNVFTIGIGGGR